MLRQDFAAVVVVVRIVMFVIATSSFRSRSNLVAAFPSISRSVRKQLTRTTTTIPKPILQPQRIIASRQRYLLLIPLSSNISRTIPIRTTQRNIRALLARTIVSSTPFLRLIKSLSSSFSSHLLSSSTMSSSSSNTTNNGDSNNAGTNSNKNMEGRIIQKPIIIKGQESSSSSSVITDVSSTSQVLPNSQQQPTSTAGSKNTTNNTNTNKKPTILCLHGKNQSDVIFALKIAGAKRKLQRFYNLIFLNAPISYQQEQEILGLNNNNNDNGNTNNTNDDGPNGYAWWIRDNNQNHILVSEAIDYVVKEINTNYPDGIDGIIGFSQGGTLATIIAVFMQQQQQPPRCIVTAGAPYHEQVFQQAEQYYNQQYRNTTTTARNGDGLLPSVVVPTFWETIQRIPKLHLAGQTDAIVAMSSTELLCTRTGNGTLYQHEQGHLFPTRSQQVGIILDFLQQHLLHEQQEK